MAGLATMSFASSVFAQATSVTGKQVAGDKPGFIVSGYKMNLQVGPIEGLTTAWHTAPQQTAIPLGSVVEFRVNAPIGATVSWQNAVQTLRTDSSAFAVAICTQPGVDNIGCRVDFNGNRYKADLEWNVVPVQLSDIVVRSLNVQEESITALPHLTGMDLNIWSMGHYFGDSVASVTQISDGRYITSINNGITVHADVYPAEFAPIVEWRDNGVAKALGASNNLSLNTIGAHRLDAGRPAASETVDVVTYKTVITSHNVQPIINDPNQEFFPEATKIGVIAETIPAGYESHITWIASTKYGEVSPALGHGPVFYTVFRATVGTEPNGQLFQWLGVKADNHAMGQDQKGGACCLMDGTCLDTVTTDCAAQGGVFQGIDTVCADIVCPLPPTDGACCLPDGSCFDTTGGATECALAGGDYQGNGNFCAGVACPPPPVTNDECVDRVLVNGGSVAFDLATATNSGPNEPTCDFPFGGAANQDINQDLWYNYIAECDGFLFVDTCGSGSIDTRIAIYDGCACPTGLPLECNDDFGNVDEADNGFACPGALEASLSIPVTAGNCYKIRVGAFSAAGGIGGADVLNITCVGAVDGGACCFADGSCADVADQAACDAGGGAYQGDGTQCLLVNCPQPGPCGPGAGDCFAPNGTPGCDNVACCEAICAADAFCCDTEWDQLCVDAALLSPDCGGSSGACCGPGGACATTADQAGCDAIGGVFQGDGTACATTVCPNDACGPGAGDCFSPNGTVGCDDVACCELICAADPFCCQTEWDQLCADAAAVSCSVAGLGACCLPNGLCVATVGSDGCDAQGGVFQGDGSTCAGVVCPQPDVCGPGAGDCFSANGTVGCENVACCESVCAADPFCCDTEWDQLCADAALLNPDCGGSSGACCGPGGACIATADQAACDAAGGVFQGDGTACATANCPNDACGPGAGDCFSPNGTVGCDDVACCELICAADPFCCQTEWDQLCADAAVANCGFTGGACCLPNGACSNAADSAACDALGGTYQGDGSNCLGVSCPQPAVCGPGAGDCFSPNGTVGCDDVACCEAICAADPFCCETEWDQLCADAAAVSCSVVVGDACCLPDGSCLTVQDEAQCNDAGGVYQGLGSACATANCPQPSACGPGAGDCFSPNGTPGCDDVACCEAICAADAFCCDTEWDQLCADAAAVDCP
jgi:hypothetical protein